MPQNWTQVWELFHRLSHRTADEQQQALRDIDDAALAGEVSDLLEAHRNPAPILSQDPLPGMVPLATVDDEIPREEAVLTAGEQLGPYRIEKLIATGGMGRVYLAQREHPFQQRVAIKTLRFSGDPAHFTARFRRERQLLAELDHPGISTLIDGGSTTAGTPYLVLNYIDGVPIDRYCEQARLSGDAIIDLLIHVCEAVQYAHQRFVVHRDIKPSNILVRADASPVLLDFGVAKLLDGAPHAALTEGLWAAPFSPDYASPEQLCGDPISAATDVYALSVLLYRLLCGELPYALAGKPVACQVDIIRSQPPPDLKPERGLRAETDLTLILQRGLAKEVQARYPTVAALVNDLIRYRNGRPVHARRVTTGYRLWRFLQRHRIAAGATVAACLIGATLAGLWVHAALQTRQALGLADANLARAQQANTFLQQVLTRADIWQPEPGNAAASGQTLLDMLNQAAWQLRHHPELDVMVQKSLFGVLIRAYISQREITRAAELAELATQRGLLVEPILPPDFTLQLATAQLLLARRQDAQALSAYTRLAEHCPQSDDPCLAARIGRARANFALGQGTQALAALERLLHGAPGPAQRTEISAVLGALLSMHGNPVAARKYLRDAWQSQEKLFGPRHPKTLRSEAHLALALSRTADAKTAEPLYAELLAPLSTALGDTHPEVLRTLARYADLEQRLGKTSEARQLYRTLLQRQKTRFGDLSPAALRTQTMLEAM